MTPPDPSSRTLRILQVHRSLGLGGVERHLDHLAAGLTARGHTVGLLTAGGCYENRFTARGARLHRADPFGWPAPPLLAEIRAARYDLVHAHNYHAARLGRRLAAHLDLPYLMSVHGPRPRLKQLLFRAWSREVVTLSAADRDGIHWRGGVTPRSRITLLPGYTIDPARFNPAIPPADFPNSHPAAPTILWVSRFSHHKAAVGHALIDALPALRRAHPRTRLLFIGDGPAGPALRTRLAALDPLATDLGPQEDVAPWLRLATVVVATATTALETMACATRLIAAGRTACLGQVNPANFDTTLARCFGDHGPRTTAELTANLAHDILATLADLPAARVTAAANARHVAAHFTPTHLALAMEPIYQRQLAPPVPA